MPEVDRQTTTARITLQPWEKLVLQISRDGRDFTFLSRVIEESGNKVTIEYPTAVEGGGVLMVGDVVQITMTRPDAVWGFASRVTEKINDQLPRMKISAPRSIERNQRRRFVRVEFFSPCRWRPILAPGENKGGQPIGDQTEGSILNLSAGGVLLVADNPPKSGHYLILKPLSEHWPLPGWLPGRIVWRRKAPEESKYRTHIGVDFREFEDMTAGWSKERIKQLPEDILNLSHAVRQKLMQLVYWREIEMRKKGLL